MMLSLSSSSTASSSLCSYFSLFLLSFFLSLLPVSHSIRCATCEAQTIDDDLFVEGYLTAEDGLVLGSFTPELVVSAARRTAKITGGLKFASQVVMEGLHFQGGVTMPSTLNVDSISPPQGAAFGASIKFDPPMRGGNEVMKFSSGPHPASRTSQLLVPFLQYYDHINVNAGPLGIVPCTGVISGFTFTYHTKSTTAWGGSAAAVIDVDRFESGATRFSATVATNECSLLNIPFVTDSHTCTAVKDWPSAPVPVTKGQGTKVYVTTTALSSPSDAFFTVDLVISCSANFR